MTENNGFHAVVKWFITENYFMTEIWIHHGRIKIHDGEKRRFMTDFEFHYARNKFMTENSWFHATEKFSWWEKGRFFGWWSAESMVWWCGDCLFVCLVDKTRVVKPLRHFHSWILSFTQDGPAFSTKTIYIHLYASIYIYIRLYTFLYPYIQSKMTIKKRHH